MQLSLFSYPDDLPTTAALMLTVLNNICIKTSSQLSIKEILKHTQYVYANDSL